MKLALMSLVALFFSANPVFAGGECKCDESCQKKCAAAKDGHDCKCKCGCAKSGKCKHHKCHEEKSEATAPAEESK